MPQPILIQDWITLVGSANQPITQSASSWVDLGSYADVVFYLEARGSSATPVISYETSPVREDRYFTTMATDSIVAGSGVSQKIVRWDSANVPLMRWVRWSLLQSSDYTATFRVWAVARAED